MKNWKSPSFGLHGSLTRAIFLSIGGLLLLLVWLLLLTQFKVSTSNQPNNDVKLYVAASMAVAVEETVVEFNRNFNKHLIVARVGGSGDLVGQIHLERTTDVRVGADLLITADDSFLQSMQKTGLIDRQEVLGYQTLVIAEAAENDDPKRQNELDDIQELIESDKRFGIGVEQAAAGRIARQLAGTRVSQLELRAKMQGENVMALGQALQLGHLDAALIWDSVVEQINRNNGNLGGQKLVVRTSLGPAARSAISIAVINKTERDKHSQSTIDQFLDYLKENEVWRSRLTRLGIVSTNDVASEVRE